MPLDLTPLAIWWRGSGPKAREGPASEEEPTIGYAEGGCPVYWPLPTLQRASSVLALGSSGAGKSIILSYALVEEFIRRGARGDPDQRQALVVVDAKGDLCTGILEYLSTRASELLDRV